MIGERPVAAVFGALSALRRKRIFHPRGELFHAEVRFAEDAPPAFGPRRAVPALVRRSRAIGLPEPLPDLLGLAVRLEDLHGPGAHQDLLLVSSADAPVLHHLLVPARTYEGRTFTSSLPYRIDGERRLLGAVAHGPRSFGLATAALGGRWQEFARCELGERCSDERAEAIRFNVWHTGRRIVPAGYLQRLRDAAYRASQEARPAT